jgi:hypothetical protein
MYAKSVPRRKKEMLAVLQTKKIAFFIQKRKIGSNDLKTCQPPYSILNIHHCLLPLPPRYD